jgi:hypothetical protein
MDLFGDLPSAKNSAESKPDVAERDTKIDSGNVANPLSTKEEDFTRKFSEPPPKKGRADGGAFQKALGTAGTTMAFVPLALRRATADSSALSKNIEKIPRNEKIRAAAKLVEGSASSQGQNTVALGDNSFQVGGTSFQKNAKSGNLDLTGRGREPKIGKVKDPENPLLDRKGQYPQLNEESDELRGLHDSVADPYDPFHPNDYLEYKDGLRHKENRAELEKQTKETLKQQHIMREQIADERRKLAFQQLAKTDIDHGAPASLSQKVDLGFGRGRGVNNLPSWMAKQNDKGQLTTSRAHVENSGSRRGARANDRNLPAWLVQKQREIQEKRAVSTSADISQASPSPLEHPPSQGFRTKSRLLILHGMVAPGETDDELALEVKEECEDKCGPVERLVIKDADISHSQVRVFVLFQKASHADRARIMFDSRTFDGRKISTQIVNENLLDQKRFQDKSAG